MKWFFIADKTDLKRVKTKEGLCETHARRRA